MNDTLQQAFKENYLSSLKDEIAAGVGLDRYTEDCFLFEPSDYSVGKIAGVFKSEDLQERMVKFSDNGGKNDFDAAVTLYTSLEEYITPLLAASENFWSYLCHVDLYKYVRKRWKTTDVPNDKLANHILTYYFFGKGNAKNFNRNALASLWWSVKCSIDENLEDRFELTRIFFINQTFRTRIFNVMLRINQGMLGILDFLKQNPEVFSSNVENRGRLIASHFNNLGGTVLLSAMPRDYFSEELERIKPEILNTQTDNIDYSIDESNEDDEDRLD